MFFSNDQTSQIDDSIRRLHQRTGVALTTVVAARCDAYPELAWKAFRGIASRLTPAVLEPVVGKMLPLLHRQEYFEALSQGLAVLESVLLEAGFDNAADASPLPGVGLIQLKNSDWRSQD
ncbi:MAG: hypothetical protein HZB87_10850 [Desulfatitalea sp.]|nr:hypothetical protein [Desulfatitalea sp.]